MTFNRLALSALILLSLSTAAAAQDRKFVGEARGTDLVAEGATATVTSPAKVVTNTIDETSQYGVFGIVGGPIRGGIRAGTQALTGGAKMAVGLLDVLTIPFRDAEPD